ncbi:MAG: class I SAM-dependent methyltransferase [Calditrichaceae bacterium]
MKEETNTYNVNFNTGIISIIMQLGRAIQMLKGAPVNPDHSNLWADLGCGDGLFTHALASLLPPQSHIYAIDKNFHQIDSDKPDIEITFIKSDFGIDNLSLPPLDGILMANSLHFIRDKTAIIQKLLKHLNENGFFIIIEYDTVRANPWVPITIRSWKYL